MAKRESNQILVTNTLFVGAEDERRLHSAGFKVVRISGPNPSESELCRRISGKVGYIPGGIEEMTARVLRSADSLKAIVFTGVDYKHYIIAWRKAMDMGIKVANTPGGNAVAVAEYTIALMLSMLRKTLELGRTGREKFMTTRSLSELTVGVVGLGNIGKLVARHARNLGAGRVLYFSRSRNREFEGSEGIAYVPLDRLLKESDIITFHIPTDAGRGFIGGRELALVKDDAIIINTSFADLIDFGALRRKILSSKVCAAFDEPPSAKFSDLPVQRFFCSNVATAFNTTSAIEKVSRMATSSMINLLKKGNDRYLVNKPILHKG